MGRATQSVRPRCRGERRPRSPSCLPPRPTGPTRARHVRPPSCPVPAGRSEASRLPVPGRRRRCLLAADAAVPTTPAPELTSPIAAADGARMRPTQANWAESETSHTLPDEHRPHSTSWTQEAHRKSMRRRAAGTPTTNRWAAGGFTPALSRAYRTSVRTRVCLHRVAPRMTRNLTSSAFAHVIQRPGEHRRSRGGVASPCRHTGSAHVSMRLVQGAPEHPSETDHRSPLFGRSFGSYPQ
jgi:hypothetical protein